MKIALVLNTSWNAYNFRSGLIRALLNRKDEVHIIAPRDEYSDKLVEMGCFFHPLPMENKGSNPLNDIFLLKNLIKLYKQIQPDVALQFTIKPNIYGSIAARWTGTKVINNVSGLGTVFLHENFTTKVARWLYKFAFRSPYKIFFQNRDDRDLFLEHKFVNPGQVDLLPGSGVNTIKFPFIPFKMHQPFTFLLMTRLLYDKGLVEFVEAIRILKKENLIFRVIVIGGTDFESALGIPKKLLDEWLTEKLFEYKGFTDKTIDYLIEADCVVLPSYREGTPKSLLEAASCGKPLIATNVPGCKEVVKDGYNGYLCEVKNAEDLALKMKMMAALDEQNLKNMGLNSRKLVEENFDEAKVIEIYLQSIQELSGTL